MSFYLLSSTVAILLGLLFVNLMTPGEIDGEPAKDQLSLSSSEVVAETLEKVEGRGTQDILDVFLRMLPPNIVKAAADGQMLGLIVFSLLFGYFILKLEAPLRKNMAEFWQAIFEIMMKMTLLIMKFSPIGIFALIANEVASTGLSAFSIMLKFFVTVALALATHIFVVMPFVLKFVAGVKPIKHYRAMIPAMTTAFSTASSAGTLPVTLECIEKKAGISNKTSSFVLPLGATINMDGTALYECVAALFIAQAYGMDLDLVTQFTVVVIALLTSIGVAGVPAASLVAITVILTAIGLPLEAVGMLLITDRVLDMMRTCVNVYSDSCCATVIARSEGERTHLL